MKMRTSTDAVMTLSWLSFLDVDEFIVPVNVNSVSEVLENYRDYPGLELTS